MTRVLLLALILALLGTLTCFARIACADDRVTTLARAAIAESGWDGRDQSGVLHVLARRARMAGVEPDEMARRYCSGFRVRKTPRLRWVLAIEPSCAQPAHWPAHLSWARWAPSCRATFARVRALLERRLVDPCRGRATHFGSATIARDLERAARAGWQRVDCGSRLTAFWRDR